ncbi:MAG TPA: hypothetical protein DEQ80_07035 [Anaerolinea thermolimosa]|uniref:ABC3 transporter permease C-terminal domain-containing protein n=1 Tax=Anaerolinea thermolimosa TaxID=229919 RepID=A0A3D1JH83_9CHLR|nr:hypothetical protein [Anaerolinea thermolimosa]
MMKRLAEKLKQALQAIRGVLQSKVNLPEITGWLRQSFHAVQNGLRSGGKIRELPGRLIQALRSLPHHTVRAFRRFLHTAGVFIIASPVLLAGLANRLVDYALISVSMMLVVVKRLRHNLGLSISAILGIVAVLGMVVCVPIFSHSVSGQVLRQQLEQKALTTRRYLFSMHMYYIESRSAPRSDIEKVHSIARFIEDKTRSLMGLPVEKMIIKVQSGTLGLRSVKPRGNASPDDPWMVMSFITQENVPKLAEIVEGEWPAPDTSTSGPIRVAVMESTADEYFLNIGDRFRYGPVEVEIAGIWRPIDPNNPEWFELPTTGFANGMWIPEETYQTRLSALFERPIFYASWYVVIDEKKVQFTHAPKYARGIVQLNNELVRVLPGITTDYSPQEALVTYQQRADALTTLFYAVGGPMVVLALLFISLTASISMQQYEQEIATMRGRGTSWGQVAGLNIIESVILIVAAILPSLLVGWLAAGIMGSTLSFLRFTTRHELRLTFQGVNFLWLFLAGLLILVARFMPMLGISRTTIVRLKQEQARGARKPLWERFYLDFGLLLPGIYAYLTQSGIAKPVKFLSNLEAAGGEQYRDILLFVAPALFAMALCMISLRVLPLITRLLAIAFDRIPGVWAYLSIQQIARRPQDHASALLLIMISLSLAIFSASSAKTLDQWLHDSQYYKAGSDLAVHEYVVQGGEQNVFSGQSSSTTLSELDLNIDSYISMEEHLRLPSVEAVTRVGKYPGTFSYGVGEQRAIFMGIDRLDFPKVAFLRDDFARQSMGELMNALALEPMGVIVPRDLAEKVGLRTGDHLLSSVSILDQAVERDLVIVGTYDYFPTVFPGQDPTLIVNLESLFDIPDAVLGYDIWLKLRPDADVNILLLQLRKLIGQERAVVKVQGNALEEVRKSMDQPERVGLFGVLNVGFIATGLMPGIGFVLYSYASLRRRFIQLGILQAVGMSVRQLIGYLALEQSLLMGLAIGSGALIGLVTSNLFVPFLQIGASPGKPIPPFEVLIGWSESAWLSLGFAVVLFLTMFGTIWYLARMKVFQAVKMGETL